MRIVSATETTINTPILQEYVIESLLDHVVVFQSPNVRLIENTIHALIHRISAAWGIPTEEIIAHKDSKKIKQDVEMAITKQKGLYNQSATNMQTLLALKEQGLSDSTIAKNMPEQDIQFRRHVLGIHPTLHWAGQNLYYFSYTRAKNQQSLPHMPNPILLIATTNATQNDIINAIEMLESLGQSILITPNPHRYDAPYQLAMMPTTETSIELANLLKNQGMTPTFMIIGMQEDAIYASLQDMGLTPYKNNK